MPVRNWGDLTTEDIRGRDMARAIAVLPVAATEQHGPHLPLATDAIIAAGYLDHLCRLPADDLDILLLPLQSIGKSDEHDAFPGTLSLDTATALAAWTGIGAAIHRAGGRKLVIVTSHGGNSALIDLVAGDLRARFGTVAVTTAWARFGYPDGLFPADEIAHGIHAGGIETALILALRPDLVRTDRIADFPPRSLAMVRDYTHLRAGRPASFAWKAGDLHPSGAMGDARLGTAEAGRAALDYGADAFMALLRDVDRFQLDETGPT